jgi:hypothetical protein
MTSNLRGAVPHDDEAKAHPQSVNIRLSADEAQLLQKFRARLQAKHGKNVRVSFKTVVLEALDELDAALRREEEMH